MPKIILEVLEWRAAGLRCPDHSVSFCKNKGGSVYPITLIQMPNGTGKTTTLELLRAALSGEALEWDTSRIAGLRKKGSKESFGSFVLALSVDNRRVTIALTFDFTTNTAKYTTTLPSGLRNGFEPPQSVNRFMRPGFVRLMAFDGELAHDLLDPKKTNAEEAIEDLYQLGLMRQMAENLKASYERRVEDQTAKEDKGITRRQNRVGKLRERLSLLKSEQERLMGEFKKVETALKSKEAKYEKTLAAQDKISQERAAAVAAVADNKLAVEKVSQELTQAARLPPSLSPTIAHDILKFRANLDRVKLPESAAREFFEELAQEKFCVCGRPIDSAAREAIVSGARNYMGSDDVSLLNAIKSDISDHIKAPEAANTAFNLLMKELSAAVGELHKARTKQEAIESKAREDNPDLKNVYKEIANERSALDRKRLELDKYADKSDDSNVADEQVFGVDIIKRRLATAEDKLAEVLKVVELKGKTDLLLGILSRAEEDARGELSKTICAETNARIEKLLPDNNIRVESIEKCLHLSGQAGGSAGETLSVSYSFLSNLFDRADTLLPFIVDSPANPIDNHVREEVGNLIPKLARQFIAFTISSEHPNFLGPLEKAAVRAAKTIKYMTVFRKHAGKLAAFCRKAKALKDSEETDDAFVVHDPDFYRSFQFSKED